MKKTYKNQFILENNLVDVMESLRYSDMSYNSMAKYINNTYLIHSKQKIYAMTCHRYFKTVPRPPIEQSETPTDYRTMALCTIITVLLAMLMLRH